MSTAPPRAPQELISLIEAVPESRILLDRDYRIVAASSAYRARYASGRRVIGRTCHVVSHGFDRPCHLEGESCPLELAQTTGQTARVLHVHHTSLGEEHVQVEITPVSDERGEMRYFVERMEPVPIANAGRSADGLVGRAPAFNRMLDLVARVAPTSTSVLLLGETGTGKELVARAVHTASSRSQAPFVPVDCSGLSETLFESELFGHERGAFTGAHSRKIGLVEAAEGGTLFLDEVGDIPMSQQVKLLRLLETGTFRRVGGVDALRADFRLVAATHRDLPALVGEERFRADLYYRISAFPIHLPALRERSEDIPLLVESLLARVRGERTLRVSRSALKRLTAYEFPGNVRELKNIVERASLLADDGHIELRHLPSEVVARPSRGTRQPDSVLKEAEKHALAEALARHRQDRRRLAAELGVSERTLYRKLRRHGLTEPRD
jgi:two-component system response regulator HydG